MIEIKNLNKYFNRHRKNQIHVINNTSLTLDNGLVALLGESGSGKTTLLNAIGGLDKVSNGNIFIDGKKITSKLSYRVDKIRNLNIGYIFQDYKLIEDLTVYDNISLVLKMIGIKDKNEIKKRVEYVLDKVGMLRYKRRPASMLSGGERQRIGIARAIVKDPNIILADEPTGNLDSKNSLEIMNIIKAISKDKLVILVTHEQSLAYFYADRIIKVQDGIITNDYLNSHTNELDYRIDNRFYLKDFKNKTNINNINIYSDKKENISLDIVVKNGNIYIKSESKIEVVDDNSNIEFIDDNYKKMDKKDIEKYEFNYKDVFNTSLVKKYKSIINPFKALISGFKKIFDYPVLKKILLLGFLLSGAFIMYSFSTIFATIDIKEEDYVSMNKNYLIVSTKKIKVDDYLKYEESSNVNYLLPSDSVVMFNVTYKDYYQTSRITDNLNGSLSSIDMIQKNDLIYGSMPINEYEIVVDKQSILNMFNQSNVSLMAGIINIEDLIGRPCSITNLQEFTIVGIVDKKSPSIYVNNSMFINILANKDIGDYELSSSQNNITNYELKNIQLKEGRLPYYDYETIINIAKKEEYKLNKEIDYKVNGKKLVVVGYYYSQDNLQDYLVNNNTIKYNVINSSNNFIVYPKNKEKALEEFRSYNLNIIDSFEKSKNDYIDSKKEMIKTSLIVSGIILLISLIEIYLMIRASFLSRVKEIGIYRAIGVKKTDIYKMFTGEILAITIITSIPGILFASYGLSVIKQIKYLSDYFVVNPTVILLSIVFVILFNLIIGILPIFRVLSKTPASILARYDLD